MDAHGSLWTGAQTCVLHGYFAWLYAQILAPIIPRAAAIFIPQATINLDFRRFPIGDFVLLLL